MTRHRLLIEDERILNSLGKIVNSLSHEPACRDDLMQEGLIHLWRSEQERPGQSTSWYLQGCRFRLQHYLCSGRSLDSGKRRSNQVVVGSDHAATDLFEEIQMASGDFDEVSVRDLKKTISASLRPSECAVLDCLADGLHTADIARRLRLSCPTVTKYRRKIAHLATKLGMLGSRRMLVPPVQC
jgi:DNA-directed RNA polymerase specialized sigma24 family protein